MKHFLNIKTFAILAVLAIAGAVVYSNYASNQANIGVELGQHIKGNPDAVVKLTEHSDFQCPACGQFAPILRDLLDQHEGKLAIEYKHFPLITIHPFAVPAAKAAEAAGQQGKFWEMHDKLFDNQQVWSRSANPKAFFVQYAEEIGLDVAQFKKQYGSSIINDHIEGQYNEARELGLTGTPSFFLNGERLQFETFEDFINQIEKAINPEADNAAGDESVVESEGSQGEVRFGF